MRHMSHPIPNAPVFFRQRPIHDVVSWTAHITAHADHGCHEQALNCFHRMRSEGIWPNAFTLVCVLKTCGSIRLLGKGKEIHVEVVQKGLLEKDVFIGTALIDMYIKCGAFRSAQQVFDELPSHNVVCWNVIIAGYVNLEIYEEVLNRSERMQCEGLSPDAFTFVHILKAYGSKGLAAKGKEVHCKILYEGSIDNDAFVATALIDMYGKCSLLAKASAVFNHLQVRSSMCWSAMIAAYSQHGHGEEALECFEQMQCVERLCPDVITFVCILKACGSLSTNDKGKEVHAIIVRQGILGTNIIVGNALANMYVRHGEFDEAYKVLDQLPVKTLVSWTTLISGHVEWGQDGEAFSCFHQMQNEGYSPNGVTFLCILKACGNIGVADRGLAIHARISGVDTLERQHFVGNALVDMYAKCCLITKAEEIFQQLLVRDIFAWNGLISGYGWLGKGEVVLHLFNKMLEVDVSPDQITFTAILNVCSQLGQVKESLMHFQTMHMTYGIIPTFKHYTCMIDLFGRIGDFETALVIIMNMPTPDHLQVWITLLGACQKLGNVMFGGPAFEHAMHLNATHAATYVSMSNVYATFAAS